MASYTEIRTVPGPMPSTPNVTLLYQIQTLG